MLRLPPSARLQWFSSGGWQISGIINSNMLGGCGCEHKSFSALSLCERYGYSNGSPPTAVPGMACDRAQKLTGRVQRIQTNRFEDFFCGGAPPHFVLLSCFSLLINPYVSRWGFDAGDGTAVPILSLQKLWKCHTVVVKGTTRSEGNPSWRDERRERKRGVHKDGP